MVGQVKIEGFSKDLVLLCFQNLGGWGSSDPTSRPPSSDGLVDIHSDNNNGWTRIRSDNDARGPLKHFYTKYCVNCRVSSLFSIFQKAKLVSRQPRHNKGGALYLVFPVIAIVIVLYPVALDRTRR